MRTKGLISIIAISVIAILPLLALNTTSASASLIGYKVKGIFDTGNLTGRSYVEIFSFDDSSKPSVLSSIPWTTELLSYSLDVEGVSKHFTLADWTSEHTFSQWIDPISGFLNSRAYLATPGTPGNPPAFSEFLDDGSPSSRSKHVKWYDWSIWNTSATDSRDSDPTVTISVPEPASIFLLGVGLFGVSFAAFRGRSS